MQLQISQKSVIGLRELQISGGGSDRAVGHYTRGLKGLISAARRTRNLTGSQVTDSKSRQEVQASKNYRDVAIRRHTRMGHEEQQGPLGSTAH